KSPGKPRPQDPNDVPPQAKALPRRAESPKPATPSNWTQRPAPRPTFVSTPGAADKAATKALSIALAVALLVGGAVFSTYLRQSSAPRNTRRDRISRQRARMNRQIAENIRQLKLNTRVRQPVIPPILANPSLALKGSGGTRKSLSTFATFQAATGFHLAPPVMKIVKKFLASHRFASRGTPRASVKILLLIPYTSQGVVKYRYSIKRTLAGLSRKSKNSLQTFYIPVPRSNTPDAPEVEALLEAYAQKGTLGYFALHDKLLAQSSWRSKPQKQLPRLAKRLGFDDARMKMVLTTRTHAATVRAIANFTTNLGFKKDEAIVIIGDWAYGEKVTPRLREAIDHHLHTSPAKPK
ncbi:hypothetical protein KJ865_09855, partial [Myxococcota bacterium]|nr:hypothetical protein [Myxococcota bacterium]